MIRIDNDPYEHGNEATRVQAGVSSIRIWAPDNPDGWIEVTLDQDGWLSIRGAYSMSVRPNVSNDIAVKVERR